MLRNPCHRAKKLPGKNIGKWLRLEVELGMENLVERVG